VIQTYSEISENYKDLYDKMEEILLARYEQLTIDEASIIACGFAVSGYGSDLLFSYLEKIILSQYSLIDNKSFRSVIRGFVVSLLGSDEFFLLCKSRIIENLNLFNITELVYIVKCYSDKKLNDKEFNEALEKQIAEICKKPEKMLLEEICAVADAVCSTGAFSREFQKLFELAINSRIKDIVANPKVSKFLFNAYYQSGMCSVGLMNILYNAFSG
jgi:hypothetical protein